MVTPRLNHEAAAPKAIRLVTLISKKLKTEMLKTEMLRSEPQDYGTTETLKIEIRSRTSEVRGQIGKGGNRTARTE